MCHKIASFFILIVALLLISGCNERDSLSDDGSIVEKQDTSFMETFTLINMEKITHELTISSHKLTFKDIDQPVIVMNLFNTLDRETMYLQKTFTQLQNKYPEDIFVISLLVGDTINTKTLNDFIHRFTLKHYISNDIENRTFQSILYKSLSLSQKIELPLTVIYSDGAYKVHYEGAVPKEMIQYDIQQAIKGE